MGKVYALWRVKGRFGVWELLFEGLFIISDFNYLDSSIKCFEIKNPTN